MSIYEYTQNFGFALSNFDTQTWHEEDWARWGRVDALLLSANTVPFAPDTGVANAYVVTYSPVITTLTQGMQLSFKVTTANTDASTLNVNGLGAVALKINGGDLIANDLPTNSYVRVIYDGTNFAVIDPKKPVNVVANIIKSNSGATPNVSTDFYVETSGNTFIELLGTDITTQGYMFSRPSKTYAGGFQYDHVNEVLSIIANGVVVGTFNNTGVLAVANITGTLLGSAATLTSTRSFTYTGDATGSFTFNGGANVSAALTIPNNTVSNAKASDMPVNTIKGRVTSGTGDPEDLTSTQATTILNNFIPDTGSGGIKGLAPAPQAGSAANDLFLGAGGTWKQSIPPSAVMLFSSINIPPGWLECSGAAVSRTTYIDLFNYIGTLYGPGDGSTTFNLPNLRGEFVRGWDNGRGIDSGRAMGSAQADEFEAHVHGITPPTSADTSSQGNTATGSGGSESITTYNSASTGGSETRPRNIAMIYCIKI